MSETIKPVQIINNLINELSVEELDVLRQLMFRRACQLKDDLELELKKSSK